ncbi:HEAT repeat domain-containing protein [Pseudomonas sp. TWP3-2]|uniref:HEAT repeat domain-containing protein n=1 Tax=Pseudomonas sp. TWP3-2 TaxID=2804574 RepID=UPI003CF6AEE1
MTELKTDGIYGKLHEWIGDSENSNWTEYTTELVAKTVLIDFANEHWNRLANEILFKPEYWQQRCAVSLGEDRSESSIEILKLLLSNSKYKDVKTIAAYELDWAEVPIEKKYAKYIRQIIENTPPEEVEPELNSLLLKAESA